jgi:thiol-disulfide isomerase/thioredoxin
MKNLLAHLLLFISLCFVFSALTSCKNTQDVVNSDVPPVVSDSETEKTKVKYPPVSPTIMKAENKLLDGTILRLEDKKGKVVLVNLWATWCGPCRVEMPHLVELQNKYRDRGFEVIGLDVDPEPVEKIQAFAKEMQLNYTLGWADEAIQTEISKLAGVGAIPQSILINREGELTGVFTGGSKKVIASLRETVEKIVNN